MISNWFERRFRWTDYILVRQTFNKITMTGTLAFKETPQKFEATNYSLNDVFLLGIMNVTNELSLNDILEERENAAGP